MRKLVLATSVFAGTLLAAGAAYAGPPASICRFLADVVGVFVPAC